MNSFKTTIGIASLSHRQCHDGATLPVEAGDARGGLSPGGASDAIGRVWSPKD